LRAPIAKRERASFDYPLTGTKILELAKDAGRLFDKREPTGQARPAWRPEATESGRMGGFRAARDRRHRRGHSAVRPAGLRREIPPEGREPRLHMEGSYRAIGASRKRVLLVWGREDRMFPFATSARVMSVRRERAT